MFDRTKTNIAILLAVMFVLTVTAAVSAAKGEGCFDNSIKPHVAAFTTTSANIDSIAYGLGGFGGYMIGTLRAEFPFE